MRMKLRDVYISDEYKVMLLDQQKDGGEAICWYDKPQMVLSNAAVYNHAQTAVMSESWTLRLTLPFFTERVYGAV